MKNTISLLFGLLFITFINSQELDVDFLESLPDDVKKDLIEKNAKQGEYSEQNYRPYLYSSKLSQAEEILKHKDRLELDLQELERRLHTGDISVDNELDLYGSNFFYTFRPNRYFFAYSINISTAHRNGFYSMLWLDS